jgi:hypothetical protein
MVSDTDTRTVARERGGAGHSTNRAYEENADAVNR